MGSTSRRGRGGGEDELSVWLGHELEEGDNPDTRAQALSERREGRGEAAALAAGPS